MRARCSSGLEPSARGRRRRPPCRPRLSHRSQRPPIPPHATFEQAKDAATALLKGDPDGWSVLKEGLMTKAREILPGKNT
jgi:hypothetical protein